MSKVKERESAARKVYMEFWDSYQSGDLEAFASTLDPDFKMIGTSESELAHSKEEGISFFKSQMEEVLGKAEMRNREIELMPIDQLILVTEHCDIYVLIESEWTFYSKIRISSLLRESDTGWKVLQQHGSLPDMRVQEGETMALDKIAKENLELRDAIKRRTIELENKSRELEIEAALERVRAVAMGMKTPDDMLQVCRVIASQLDSLGVRHIRNVQTAIIESKEEIYLCYQFFPSYDQDIIERTEYPKNPVEQEMVDQMLAAKDNHFMGVLKNEELKDFREHRKNENYLTDPLLDEVNDLGYCFLSIGEGGLGLTLYQSLDEQSLALFKRFHQVFSLAYQRFRDIQKAEAQAREAQIEAALERVRSTSMAMHSSEELQGVIREVYEQLSKVGIKLDHAGFVVDYEAFGDWHFWIADEADIPSKITHPYFESVWANQFNEAKQKGIESFSTLLDFEEKNRFYRELLSHVPNLPKASMDFYLSCPGLAITTVLFDKVSLYMENFEGIPYSSAENEILLRFGRVFKQAYTRFLDLQKAEAQAREAQIEAALEKVRSRSLAMHKSNELNEVVSIVFEKLKELQIPATAVGIGIAIEGSKDLDSFVCGQNEDGLVITNYRLPYFDNPVPKDLNHALNEQLDFFVGHYSKAEKDAFYNYVIEHTAEFKHLPEDILRMIFESTTYSITSVAVRNAVFNINDFEGKVLAPSEIEIIQRFARVFDQAYTRFLDLQKSEAQAREAQIEAALERVRSASMAMHKSDDLLLVIKAVHEQITELGIKVDASNFQTYIENSRDFYLWAITTTHSYQQKIRVNHIDFGMTKQMWDAWDRGDSFAEMQSDADEMYRWWNKAFEVTELSHTPAHRRKIILSAPGWNSIVARRNTVGLQLHRYNLERFTEQEKDILDRLATVFEQSYTRFLDLQKSEAQAREAQIEASLERVRSQAMAMRQSDDLVNCTRIIFDELENLNLSIERSGIGIFDPETRDCELWTTVINEEGKKELTTGITSLTVHPLFISTFDSWLSQTPLSYTLEGQELQDYYNLVSKSKFVLADNIVEKSTSLPKEYYHYSPFAAGGLYFFADTEPTNEDKKIIRRFAEVFDLTYTRFLDLQKAEAQAREAQIEAGLERVRSASMAMHRSQELEKVVEVTFSQLQSLMLPIDGCQLITFEDQSKDFHFWSATPDMIYPTRLNIPYFDHPIFSKFWKARERGKSFLSFDLTRQETLDFYNHLYDNTNLGSSVTKERWGKIQSIKHGFKTSWGIQKNTGLWVFNFSNHPFTNEENSVIDRFAKVFEQSYTRFLDLQKAEAQAREAQIEAALERVRSRSMAMHSSSELGDTALVVFQELNKLGIDSVRGGIALINETLDQAELWLVTEKDGKAETQILGRARGKDHYFYKNYLEAFRRKEDYSLSEFAGKELEEYYQVASQFLNVPIPKKFPEREFYYGFYFNEGAINVIARRALEPDELSIGLRFSKVFGLVYRRFLDLQNAEKQAREAQIEAALERVRSKAMAMHNTGDLANANSIVFDELNLLGIAPLRSGIGLIEAETGQGEMFSTVPSGEGNTLQLVGKISLTNNPILESIFDHWTKKQVYTPTLNGQELKEYYDLILASYGDLPKPKFSKNEVQYGYFLPFKHGDFYAWTQDPFNEDELKVIKRFVSVIDLTYNRYFDLKKAEAQAREAQIEAALERIRSRSMAMHKTSELSEVILVLFKQFEHLNLVVDTCYIDIFDEANRGFNVWIGASTAIYPKQVWLPYCDHPIHLLNKNARKNGIEFFTFDEDKRSKEAYFEHFYPKAEGIDVPEERKKYIARGMGLTGSATLGIHSGITMFNYQKNIYSEEENNILKRMNKVFQQTYTRFLDLQKAETQAREAVKQSSLDRVRAEIASMRTAKDLERITPLVWKELQSLGVPFFRCGVMLVNEEKEVLDFYLSNPEGKALAALHLDYDNSEITRKGVKHWREQTTYIEHWTQEQFLAFTKSLLEQGQISNISTYQGGEKPPTSLTLQFVPFTQGMVYVGSETDLSAEELDLVAALGRSLSVAYARYEDFTRLDMAKAKAEQALKDLKSAQEQLVQQEKLASLGQLTAGIAHEIKNPLNFVNNFSDLSRELIEEILEERAKNQESRDESLIDDILEDIKSNLQKVHEHGSRADGIVTSMLQHSRASGSKREPKAFNPMVQEFVNLSYHGMRAGKAPINVKIDLQLDPQVGEVSLISEDFSRVILNLCNNAFDAMRDKLLKSGDRRVEAEDGKSYLPKLTVKTVLQSDQVLLSIADNGGGIPEEIKDKILQPFFTTKKGTEGTGLGLSITHDIIKAHGGKLSVESEINKNTSFTISIPISQSVDGKK
ncbi:ATP-binding protein [Algoriphagus namhaensis]|uniref:histidine kinase n=1 Tax=Algoriphagus namhaensis TaxID=915353 RepID=A0ABV8ASR0_9BACT